jgi:hypothetical protein
MALDATIYTCLSGDTGVTTLCSTRIYPMLAPQNAARPFVTWQEISSDPIETHDDIGLSATRTVQFSCWATTISAAKALRSAVIAAIAADFSSAVLDGTDTTQDPITADYGAIAIIDIHDDSP